MEPRRRSRLGRPPNGVPRWPLPGGRHRATVSHPRPAERRHERGMVSAAAIQPSRLVYPLLLRPKCLPCSSTRTLDVMRHRGQSRRPTDGALLSRQFSGRPSVCDEPSDGIDIRDICSPKYPRKFMWAAGATFPRRTQFMATDDTQSAIAHHQLTMARRHRHLQSTAEPTPVQRSRPRPTYSATVGDRPRGALRFEQRGPRG